MKWVGRARSKPVVRLVVAAAVAAFGGAVIWVEPITLAVCTLVGC
jgi:hypothetical protein